MVLNHMVKAASSSNDLFSVQSHEALLLVQFRNRSDEGYTQVCFSFR